MITLKLHVKNYYQIFVLFHILHAIAERKPSSRSQLRQRLNAARCTSYHATVFPSSTCTQR